MRHVWLLERACDHEDSSVLGVYGSRARAVWEHGSMSYYLCRRNIE